MVKITTKGKTYDYDKKAHDSIILNKAIKEDFSKFCKEHKINKSKLIQDFYKSVLLRFKEGSLNLTSGYITIKIL